MAIIRNPKLFTSEFGVPTSILVAERVFDPVLNVDTPLFIDPLLLAKSSHSIIAQRAAEKMRTRFETIYKLLAQPQSLVIDETLQGMVRFDEVASTCLGYTAGGIGGHGFGPQKSANFLYRARQVQATGRTAPEILPALAILEGGVGADLISDMTTNIIAEELCEFTADFCRRHGVATEKFEFAWGDYMLPRNRYINRRVEPVLLVPSDVLRELPETDSWEDVVKLSQTNANLRARVGQFIGGIMRDTQKSMDQRRALAAEAIQKEAEAVARIGEFLANEPRTPYPTFEDPHSHRVVQRILGVVEKLFPMAQPLKPPNGPDEMRALVLAVCEQFKFLVESHEVWKMFWVGDKRLREEVPQRAFHIVAHSYCSHYNVHIAVEHHTGNGRTDFVFSQGSDVVVVVELKWSDNPKLLTGYARQVKEYIKSEKAISAVYLILDCDGGDGYSRFQKEIVKPLVKCDDISVILADANPKKSPSKLPPL